MNAHARGIVEALARAKRDGLEPKSLYLSPDYREALGLAEGAQEIGGLPLKPAARRSVLYCRHGIRRAVSPAKVDGKGAFTPAEQLLLVSLLQGWPTCVGPSVQSRLRMRGLLATRERGRRHGGREVRIAELRLTGLGEDEAQRLWDRLGREERAELRGQAMRSGL